MKSGIFECSVLSGSQRFFTDLNSVRLCIFSPKLNCLSSKQGHRSISVTYVGTEELAHLEMVGTIVYQLTRNLTQEEIQKQGFDAYFIDHTTGVYPVAASGAPFSAASIAVTGDTLADINEDLAAEQKARVTYDNILRFADDPDVRDPIKFLREREIVHYQRFGEAKREDCSKIQRRGKPTNSALLESHYQSEHLQDIGMSRPICCYTSK